MKEIILTKGNVAIVDDEDYDEISKYKWRTQGDSYAARDEWEFGVRKQIYMHREVMEAKDKEVVDHINHNTLDNRRENLRVCAQVLNMANARIRSDNTSGYKGVTWYKRDKKWKAQLQYKGKNINLGTFESRHDAAKMYNFWAYDLFGEYALLNKINADSEAVADGALA